MHFNFGGHGRGCGPRGGWQRGRRQWGPFEMEWSFGPGERGRGGGRRRMFSGDELRLVLLALIADAPRHGYDLIREIEERTGGAYAPSPGVVYPTLTLLAEMGYIEERESDGAKKLYGVTPAGQAHLEEQAEAVAALLGRLAQLGTMRQRTDGGPVRRAMGNLKTALRERVARDEVERDTLHEIAAILDEATRRIERL